MDSIVEKLAAVPGKPNQTKAFMATFERNLRWVVDAQASYQQIAYRDALLEVACEALEDCSKNLAALANAFTDKEPDVIATYRAVLTACGSREAK